MTEQKLDEINLYPEMNAKIVGFLAGSDKPLYQYSAALLKHLQKENATLKEKLMSAHDEFQALTIFLKGMEYGNSILKKALKLAVQPKVSAIQSAKDLSDYYIQQAQEQENNNEK